MKKSKLIFTFAIFGLGSLAILFTLQKKPAGNRRIPAGAARNERFLAEARIQPAGKSEQSSEQPGYRTWLSEISNASDPESRDAAVARFVQSVPLNQVPQTLLALSESKDPSASELGLALLRRWAEREPALAAAWAQKSFANSGNAALFQQIGIAWANSDLAAAVNWANALAPGPDHDSAVLAVAAEAARTDPVTALDLAGGLPPSQPRDNLLVHAISQWALAAPQAALAWGDKVPQPGLRQDVLAAALIAFADKDPATAATVAATTLEPGAVLGRVSVAIVQRWAAVDAPAAAAWVAEFPESPARHAAAQVLAAAGLR